MSKKVTKVVQKEVTVSVCDTCGKETDWNGNVEIDIEWFKSCPRDNCYEDWGSFEFCSYDCFIKGSGKITTELDADENFHYQRFNIKVSGVGEDEKDGSLFKMLKLLSGDKSND